MRRKLPGNANRAHRPEPDARLEQRTIPPDERKDCYLPSEGRRIGLAYETCERISLALLVKERTGNGDYMHPISRRTLLKNGATTAAGLAMLSAWPASLRAKSLAKSPGIQLYTVSKELTENLDATLEKIAAIGYRTVESAGLAGKSAADFRKALDNAGLKCPSSHLFPTPGQSRTQFLDVAKTLGSEYVVPSVLINTEGLKSVDDYIKVISALNEDDYKKMGADL